MATSLRTIGTPGSKLTSARRQAGRDVEDLSEVVVVGAPRFHTIEEDRVEVDGSTGG